MLTQEVVLSPTASSYSMAQLAGSTEYSVRLQAIAGAQRSHHIDTAFTTSKEPVTPPGAPFLASLSLFSPFKNTVRIVRWG